MQPMILSVDQGTTNTKALLVGADGRPVFRASAPLALLHPKPGFAEQDPEAIWRSVQSVIGECLAFIAADGNASIEGIAISNQRETALAWERRAGRPIAPAMSWQCRRSAALCASLRERAEFFRERIGLPLDPLISASKWAWLLRETEGLAQRAASGEICFGTVDSWLIYKLTGGTVHACDASNASRTGLLNVSGVHWDTELLAMFGVPIETLPEVRSSSGVFGNCMVIPDLDGVPIVAAIGDSHAALLGHGSPEPGTVKATYGTGSSLMTLTPGFPEPDARLATTIAWSTGETVQYALEGNISMTGSAIQWVGQFLGLAKPVRDTLALAATVPDAGSVLFVPAMVGLGSPYWDTSARGTISGLDATSTSAHLARAALDAIAFLVRDVFDAMEEASRIPLPALRADGGATRNNQLMQLQADTLGRPVIRSACEDLSALGAAWLSGMALGWWRSAAEFASLPEMPTVFEPQLPAAVNESRYRSWQTAIRRTLLPLEEDAHASA
jgi:glycerol kinase